MNPQAWREWWARSREVAVNMVLEGAEDYIQQGIDDAETEANRPTGEL